ncbi:AB hydrolase-1 domain-containing protein [Mycena kentingensis (nom. inval.)]|nr:AB hydrolase-1 domain-containing protein [Mycena kentingensis (nom. inval.)]
MATIPQIDQNIFTVPEFTLECGSVLKQAPVAYKTWGRLNETRDNVMVICHALTGSADVEDWWGPLMGRNKAFDPTRFFVFCANTLGSPYGSASPITTNPDTGKPYGPSFPPTTIRDDVRIHQHVLRTQFGVSRVAVVIGGSMGGMATLEWPLIAPGFVQRIVVLATSARHSAWCIAWGESQRQSIYSDPAYKGGYYELAEQPRNGLAAARMCALLTYRSRDSFERRFGRKQHAQTPSAVALPVRVDGGPPLITPPASPPLGAVDMHNDGHRPHRSSSVSSLGSDALPSPSRPPIFSAQSYLRYQGDKFIARFDANCYIHITRKMDTHDLARGRITEVEGDAALIAELGRLPPHALVISIQSDGLFTPPEQTLLATHIPESQLVLIPSGEGHDGFLVEFEEINHAVLEYLHRELAEVYVGDVREVDGEDDFAVKKESVFGEAEVDLTRW